MKIDILNIYRVAPYSIHKPAIFKILKKWNFKIAYNFPIIEIDIRKIYRVASTNDKSKKDDEGVCWRPRTWCFKTRRPTMSTSTHPRQNAGLPTSVLQLVRLIARRSGGRSPIRSALQNKYPPPRHASTDGTTSEWCLEGEVESAADISFVGSGEYYTRTLSLISPRSGAEAPYRVDV